MNGIFVSGCQMVRYLNGGLKTKLKKPKAGQQPRGLIRNIISDIGAFEFLSEVFETFNFFALSSRSFTSCTSKSLSFKCFRYLSVQNSDRKCIIVSLMTLAWRKWRSRQKKKYIVSLILNLIVRGTAN